MNKSNKAVGAGVAVAAVVLVKLAAKTAFIAAIFGGTFGGVSYAKTEYEMSMTNIKRDVSEYSAKHGGEYFHEGLQFNQMRVDEPNKRIVVAFTWTNLTSDQVDYMNRTRPGFLAEAVEEDRQASIKHFQQEKDYRVLFNHGWSVEYVQKTGDGRIVEDYTIAKNDLPEDAR